MISAFNEIKRTFPIVEYNIIKRIIKYKKEKGYYIGLFLVLLLPIVMIIYYINNKRMLFSITRKLFLLPWQIYVFFGVSRGEQGSNSSFFIFYMMMFLNLFFVYHAIKGPSEEIRKQQKSSVLYMTLGQMKTAEDVFWEGYIWHLIKIIPFYIVWNLIGQIIAMLGAYSRTQRFTTLGLGASSLFRGVGILFFLITVSYVYGIVSRKDCNIKLSGYIWGFLGILFILGNLYKVKDYIIYFNVSIGKNMESIAESLKWLDKLYWVSPLSLMNPVLSFGLVKTI
ncbi:MAG: hypothetical protein K6B41_14380, partial [Butyrivibrio sp.]|nr:hypothetical protein [Butyrivibrio sp.]